MGCLVGRCGWPSACRKSVRLLWSLPTMDLVVHTCRSLLDSRRIPKNITQHPPINDILCSNIQLQEALQQHDDKEIRALPVSIVLMEFGDMTALVI